MGSVVSSEVVTPKPVFPKELLASPSASGKTVASASHIFGTGGTPPCSSSDGIKDSSGKDAAADSLRERDLPITKLSIRDVLDLLPEAVSRVSMTGFSPRWCWASKEDDDVLQLKVAMPGLGTENVKVQVEEDTLVIKGEGDKDSDGDGDKGPALYSYRIRLSSQAYKMDQIKAEMEDGMVMVTVPKIKDEERKDVFEIKMETSSSGSNCSSKVSWSIVVASY